MAERQKNKELVKVKRGIRIRAVPESERRHGRVRGLLKVFSGMLLLGIIMLGAVYLYNMRLNQNFKTTFYQVSSGKVSDELRIIQLSDLHNSVYGNDNSELTEKIRNLEPDIIVMTGDMIEEKGEEIQTVLDLCKELSETAPIYYIYGNHETLHSFGSNDMSTEEIDELLGTKEGTRSSEGFRTIEDDLKEALEKAGAKVLWNEMDTIALGENTVEIYGVLTGHPYAFWQFAEETFTDFRYQNPENFKLLLCHEPYIFETWKDDSWADLALAGHTHGGAVRLPKVGALFEYRHGLFPETDNNNYVYGEYDVQGYPLIVSGGLSRNDLLRINNQPELVVIDINRY